MTKTSEDIYFIVAVTGMFYGVERPAFTIDIDGRDSHTYLFDKKSKQTMEILFPANGLDFGVPHSLNITLTNKDALDNLVSNTNSIIEHAGIEIVNIAAVFMPSKRQFTVPSNFGIQDTTGRTRPESALAPHLMKFGEQTGMKFWLNGDILSKECKFYTNEVKPVSGKNFKMTTNGRYALEFKSPINYWVLQRFYVLDK
jgi:hypothetical protein